MLAIWTAFAINCCRVSVFVTLRYRCMQKYHLILLFSSFLYIGMDESVLSTRRQHIYRT